MDIERDLARIELQEERLRFESFDAATAWKLGAALKQLAETGRRGVAIDVSSHAQTLFHYATAGATPDNTEWVRRKRNTTLRFFRSSYAIGLELQRDGRTLQERFGLGSDFKAHGGSFPLRLGTTCIGAVTVSGLPQREDHNLVVQALALTLAAPAQEIALDPVT